MGKVFVFCEYSDVVGSAFRAEGHDVTSCDLLPSEGSPNHYQGDGRHLLREPWDLVIAHPPCSKSLTAVNGCWHSNKNRNSQRWEADLPGSNGDVHRCAELPMLPMVEPLKTRHK